MATLRNAFVCVLSNIVRYKRIFRSLFHHSGSPIVWYERKPRVLSNPLVFDTFFGIKIGIRYLQSDFQNEFLKTFLVDFETLWHFWRRHIPK